MDTIRKIFPYSFQPKNDLGALITNILMHIVASIVIGFICFLLLFFPVVRILASIVSSLTETYLAIGVVISILDYLKVFK